MKNNDSSPNKGGRPPKFGEPSRPVTVTLPLSTLEHLAAIDADRAKAIVKATQSLHNTDVTELTSVGELPFTDAETLLVVPDNRFLRRIPWLSLIEVSPGRHLLSLKSGTSLEKLEVTLGDFLDAPGDASPAELDLLRTLLECLRTPRRNRAVHTEEILVISKAPPSRQPTRQ